MDEAADCRPVRTSLSLALFLQTQKYCVKLLLNESSLFPCLFRAAWVTVGVFILERM